MHDKRIFGNTGEDSVVDWLKNNGFTILSRNYQTRLGEIDIIAAKDVVIAFVEVKTRHSEYFPIAQTVTYTKQQRIIRAARHYILTHQLQDKVFRFDIATVLVQNSKHNILYIPNAFLAKY